MKALFAGDLSFAWLPPVNPGRLIFSAMGDLLGQKPSPEIKLSPDVGALEKIRRKAIVSTHSKSISKALSPVVTKSDLFCANLESVLSLRGEPVKGKKFTLRSDPAYVSLLKQIGITDVAMSNNHILDFGAEALEETCGLLDSVQIRLCGLRRGSTTQSPTIVQHADSDIAMFNYVDPAIIDPDPALFLTGAVTPFGFDLEQVLTDIKPYSGKHAIVVIVHWGEEWSRLESDSQRYIAHQLIDNGVAVIIGHHSHVAGGIEEYKEGLIAYSLGNLFMHLPPFGFSRASGRHMVMAKFLHNRLDAYNIIGLGNDNENIPRIDNSLNCNSLQSKNELTNFTSGASVRFDSIADLSKAKVSSPNVQTPSEYQWSENFMVDSRFVRGLFPLGPGWSGENHLASGVRISRELSGSDFLSVAIMYCTEGNSIEVSFNLPDSLSKLIILTGYPDSLYLQTDFNPSPLQLMLGDQKIDLPLLEPRSEKWTITELSRHEIADNRVITLSASPSQSETDFEYLFSVACFRILGI